MYIINRENNEAHELDKKTFSDLGFSERAHLQEWIDKNPRMLGENLLIIQKEFDGFSETQERLDLLALDEQKRLVVIENKLDTSGRDVVWQALKYVSYCAELSTQDIRDIYQKYLDKEGRDEDAGQNIADFYRQPDFDSILLNENDSNQRIILVAASFRREVTSTVLWLQKNGLDIKCIKTTPYQRGEDTFLSVEQVLPAPDTDEYRIHLNIKTQQARQVKEEISAREEICQAFWTYALPVLQSKTSVYDNRTPVKEQYLQGAFGVGDVYFTSNITRTTARAEIQFMRQNPEENSRIYEALLANKERYEEAFGEPLHWGAFAARKSIRLYITLHDVAPFDGRDDWDKAANFLGDKIERMVDVFSEPIREIVESM